MTVLSLPPDKYDWVGVIETYSGSSVDVMNFDLSSVNLDDIAQSLALICRYNGHIPSFYSVAEHSVRVAWWLRQHGYDEEIQLSGLLHDAAECYVGDMIRPLKRVPEVGKVHQGLEHAISKQIHTVLGGTFPHPKAVHDADRAIYDWEVANIRTGKATGWSWDMAKEAFLDRYQYLTSGLVEA